MNTKYLLIAASTLALAACGGAEVEQAEIAENDGSVETLASPDQPPLEGDSPFVDGTDVADSTLDQENYDTGLDGTDLQPTELTDAEPDLDDRFASDDLDGDDELFDDEGDELALGGDLDSNDEFLDDEGAEAFGEEDDVELATLGTTQTDGVDSSEQPVSDGVSAKQYTADTTDATISDGELITGSEATMLSGTYDVTLPDAITVAGTPELYIDGTGNQAVGTFAGEPIEVSVTGANFQFDAPVTRDGSEELMTFTGTFDNGMISNGVVEAQGDGTTMDWSADRTSEALDLGRTGMDAGATGDMDGVADDFDRSMDATDDSMDRTMDSMDRTFDDGLDATGDTLDDAGQAIESGADQTGDAIEGAYDRGTDGLDSTEALDPNDDF